MAEAGSKSVPSPAKSASARPDIPSVHARLFPCGVLAFPCRGAALLCPCLRGPTHLAPTPFILRIFSSRRARSRPFCIEWDLMPLSRKHLAPFCVTALVLLLAPVMRAALPQNTSQSSTPKSSEKQSAQQKSPSRDEEFQQAIDSAGNDRAALVRNLEAFLKKYPEAPQRVRIYRALVEATLQLRDTTRAADYAERIVSLAPDDMSMTLVAIQLLERNGDEAGIRRATNYSTRVLEYIDRGNDEKSPKISKEEWETSKNHDRMTVLLLRGRLYLKLHETSKAQQDFEDSYGFEASSGAAEKLGEIAELNKDLPRAIQQYARAFALADAKNGADRREIRQKLGNVWRLTHASDEGLGEYTLRTYDEVTQSPANATAAKNANAK